MKKFEDMTHEELCEYTSSQILPHVLMSNNPLWRTVKPPVKEEVENKPSIETEAGERHQQG